MKDDEALPPGGEEAHDDGVLPMPSFEGIVAGTVALMTSWAAEAQATGGAARHHDLLARKIISNLFFMAHHPRAQGPLACALANARERWIELAGATAAPMRPPAGTDGPPSLH